MYSPVFLCSGVLLLIVNAIFFIPAYLSILITSINSKNAGFFFFNLFLFPLLGSLFIIIESFAFYAKMWRFPTSLNKKLAA